MINGWFKSVAVLGILAGAATAGATPINAVIVQKLGIGANRIVNVTSSTLGNADVFAGVVKLSVDKRLTDGFCIDPWHWSVGGPQPYLLIPLQDAPKQFGPMGTSTAVKIEQLWGHFYSPTITDNQAAGLQIAIWELVDSAITAEWFHLNSPSDYGASDMLDWVNDNPTAPRARLVAVTGRGQDYAIPCVPDGGWTVVLVGIGLVGFCLFGRRAPAA